MYLLVIKQIIIMLIIAASSFAISKTFKFGKTELQFVSRMLLLYINPCLILSHFDLDYDVEKLKQFGIVVVLSIVAHFLLALVALIFARSKNEEEKELDCLDKLATVLTNCGFIGIPLIEGVLGHEGVFYLLAYIATFNVFVWTYGYHLMSGKVLIRKIITNPNIICVIAGIIVFCIPVRLPEVISKPISLVGSMNTAMAMILLGMLFANFKRTGETSYTKRLIKVCILRHVASAFVMFALAFVAIRVFANVPDIRTMSFVVFIAGLCPTAMSVSSMAVIFDKDKSYAALLCMVTSVVCVVSLPLSVGIAELFI